MISRLIFIFLALVIGYFLGQISVLYNLLIMSEESFFASFFKIFLLRKKSEDKKK